MTLKPFIPLLFSTLLMACGTTPSSVIIAPQVNTASSVIYDSQNVSLVVTDLRTNNHIIQVLKSDEAATLYSPASNMAQTLSNSLSEQYKKQGLNIDAVSATDITIFIDAALVSVQQETIKYTANSEIRLRVQVKKNDKTLTNHFNSKGSSNGPLFADIAVLERDFNQQLGKVIEEVLLNKDIQAFIKA